MLSGGNLCPIISLLMFNYWLYSYMFLMKGGTISFSLKKESVLEYYLKARKNSLSLNQQPPIIITKKARNRDLRFKDLLRLCNIYN